VSLVWFIAAMLVIVTLFPVFWVIAGSFKSEADSYAYPPKLIPFLQFQPTLDHWTGPGMGVLNMGNIVSSLLNSTVIALGSSMLAVGIGSLAAYSLARYKFVKWKNEDIGFWILSNRMFPPAALIIPYLLMFKAINLLDTQPAVIIAHGAMNLPLAVWIAREFFAGLPKETEESALVDGCSPLGAFLRVALPLSIPGLVVCWILCFIFSWNELLFALTITSQNAVTLSVMLSGQGRGLMYIWGTINAIGTLSIIVPLILGFAIQKHIAKGLSFGAVKG
jgi:multiple sugar transport system permease protein